jgi:hypothetical protein
MKKRETSSPIRYGVYNLSDCSIVIPVHIDSMERLEHIHFLYHFFKRNFIHHQLIILEQGNEPRIDLPPSANIQIEFIKDENEFSLSEMSNRGASFVNRPFFCKYDADALIHPKAIFDAFELLKNQPQLALVLPYNGISYSIANELRKKMLQTADFSSLPFVKMGEAIAFQDMYLKCEHSNGLIHHFRTDVFKELGGYNEEFIGWGYEDTEMINRFHTLGYPKTLLENYNAFHLEHPRKGGDEVQIFRNYCRKQAYSAMSPEELLNSIKAWNRFGQ